MSPKTKLAPTNFRPPLRTFRFIDVWALPSPHPKATKMSPAPAERKRQQTNPFVHLTDPNQRFDSEQSHSNPSKPKKPTGTVSLDGRISRRLDFSTFPPILQKRPQGGDPDYASSNNKTNLPNNPLPGQQAKTDGRDPHPNRQSRFQHRPGRLRRHRIGRPRPKRTRQTSNLQRRPRLQSPDWYCPHRK